MAALTLARDFRWEQVIEKSRFICSLKKVQSEAEAQEFIKAVKKEYWDASHNCSAYLIDELAQRSSDDGEPSGTAGVPMLEVLRKQNLCQVAAVVTRYFGGIKLGAGGLIRAYGGTVAQALSQAGLAERVVFPQTPVRIEYRLTEKGRELEKIVSDIDAWNARWEGDGASA